MDDYDNDYMCNNCQGSGYFDMPDGSEKACSVCGGAGGVDQKDVDALRARAEAAEALVAEAQAENNRLRALIINAYNTGTVTGVFMREALQVTEAELSGAAGKE